MADESMGDNLEGLLRNALAEAESLQARIQAGEDIDEKELQVIARLLASQMEEARTMLEAAVGPVDPEALKANLKAKLSPEEYEEWLASESARTKLRAEMEAEKTLRKQLEGPGE